MDALLQDTPEIPVPFEDEDLLRPGLPGADPRSDAGGPRADDGHVYVHLRHGAPPSSAQKLSCVPP